MYLNPCARAFFFAEDLSLLIDASACLGSLHVFVNRYVAPTHNAGFFLPWGKPPASSWYTSHSDAASSSDVLWTMSVNRTFDKLHSLTIDSSGI